MYIRTLINSKSVRRHAKSSVDLSDFKRISKRLKLMIELSFRAARGPPLQSFASTSAWASRRAATSICSMQNFWKDLRQIPFFGIQWPLLTQFQKPRREENTAGAMCFRLRLILAFHYDVLVNAVDMTRGTTYVHHSETSTIDQQRSVLEDSHRKSTLNDEERV